MKICCGFKLKAFAAILYSTFGKLEPIESTMRVFNNFFDFLHSGELCLSEFV